MKLSHYIKELLFEHEYVIIPGFGAFVSNYKPAYFDEGEKVFFPPSKDISFNSKLKNNDGLLIKYISETEGITDFSANKKIEKERENILYKLDSGEKVKVIGVGVLYMDDKKQICFDSSPEDNLLMDSFGLETTSLNEEKEEPVKEVFIPEKENKKKKKRYAWIWVLIIPIGIAGIFIYLNYKHPPIEGLPTEKQEITENEDEPSTQEVIQNDTIAKDTISIDTTAQIPVTETEEKVVEPQEQDGPVYYLIGGSFGVKANADKYFNRVKTLGYKPAHLGKQGNLYVVAVEKYFNMQEAEKAQREFKDMEPDSGVWILTIDN